MIAAELVSIPSSSGNSPSREDLLLRITGTAKLRCRCGKDEKFLDDELKASANGIAIFACSGADLFEAIQLNTPLEDNYLYVYNQPHLYHLTRLDDAYPRYAALVPTQIRLAFSSSAWAKPSKPSR